MGAQPSSEGGPKPEEVAVKEVGRGDTLHGGVGERKEEDAMSVSSCGSSECSECLHAGESAPEEGLGAAIEEDDDISSDEEEETLFIGPNTVEEDLFGHRRYMTGWMRTPRRARWFALNDEDLTGYYRSLKDRTKNLYLQNYAMRISLSDIQEVVPQPSQETFLVKTFKKEYTLKTKNKERRQQWMAALSCAIEANKQKEAEEIASLSLSSWLWRGSKRYWWQLRLPFISFYRSADHWEDPIGFIEAKALKQVTEVKKLTFKVTYMDSPKGGKEVTVKLRGGNLGDCRKWTACLQQIIEEREEGKIAGERGKSEESELLTEKAAAEKRKIVFSVTEENIQRNESLEELKQRFTPIEGWLLKNKKDRRWCKIEDFVLSYYFDAGSWADRMGCIPLEEVQKLVMDDVEEIKVYTKRSTYRFNAETPDDYQSWCRSLKSGMVIAYRLREDKEQAELIAKSRKKDTPKLRYQVGQHNKEDNSLSLSLLEEKLAKEALERQQNDLDGEREESGGERRGKWGKKEGWLSKKVGLGVHQRWFKLDSDYLHYYDGDGAWSEGLGSISLLDVMEIKELYDAHFALLTKGRDYHLTSDNAETMADWIHCIWANVRLARRRREEERREAAVENASSLSSAGTQNEQGERKQKKKKKKGTGGVWSSFQSNNEKELVSSPPSSSHSSPSSSAFEWNNSSSSGSSNSSLYSTGSSMDQISQESFTPLFYSSWVTLKGKKGRARVWMILNGTVLQYKSGNDEWAEVRGEIPLSQLSEVARSVNKNERFTMVSKGRKETWKVDVEKIEDRDIYVKHIRSAARYLKRTGRHLLALRPENGDEGEEGEKEAPLVDVDTRLKNFLSLGMKGWMAEKKLTSLSPSAERYFVLSSETFSKFSGDDSWADLLWEVPVSEVKNVENYGTKGLKVVMKKRTLRLFPQRVDDFELWKDALTLLSRHARDEPLTGREERQKDMEGESSSLERVNEESEDEGGTNRKEESGCPEVKREETRKEEITGV